ncbi:MAG: hypothetical protein PQJ61_11800 [Spirochaetales bacterium]|uniref:Uncharacterized protein n=1 Tax=Candidatus Thalassospirochaeta sargassi TaxID=3119039 RepID=A0AAJ1IDP5_9SPIO|nr:hypothetical protein [Spirochaetales bacterium]
MIKRIIYALFVVIIGCIMFMTAWKNLPAEQADSDNSVKPGFMDCRR